MATALNLSNSKSTVLEVALVKTKELKSIHTHTHTHLIDTAARKALTKQQTVTANESDAISTATQIAVQTSLKFYLGPASLKDKWICEI